MPDCSKGLKSRPSSRSGQAYGNGSRGNRERCRNCEIMEASINDAKRTLREVKRELRKKVRELRNKREKMNLILLTVIDICDQGSPKLNRRAIEEKIKNPEFMLENVNLANTIASLVDRYREEAGEFDTDTLDEEEE